MKKRFLAFLLAVCVAVSMLVLPASAVGSNAAVQTATPPQHRAAPAVCTATWTVTRPTPSTSAPPSRTAG